MAMGTRGRPFNRTWPLGQLMYEEMVTVNALAAKTGVSHRKISDYLANRVPILPRHMMLFCDFFHCEPDDLTPDEPPSRTNVKEGAYG